MSICDNYIIIRTNIIGINAKTNKFNFAEWIYNSLSNNKFITLFKDYYFSPIHTTFLGEIIKNLIKLKFEGILNVGSADYCSR